MQSVSQLQQHTHRFNMWIGPNASRPAMPCSVCRAVIGQHEAEARGHLGNQVQCLTLLPAVVSGRPANTRTTDELVRGLIYSLTASVIRLKLTDVK